MGFFKLLYLLIIYPLELLFEIVFSLSFKQVGNYGLSIIWLSVVVNTLVLPLYARADKIQAEQRLMEEKITPGANHIKKAFTGDERFMMLQTYYKLNNYHPVMALRSTASLLLQIPFFMAAYNMLSNLKCLQGVSFWFIRDLGQPDAMFSIGSFSINILPILMTLINVITGFFYTKGHSVKEKIQLNGMALIFLLLLYNSPSGLAFYWMLNNVYSFVKTIIFMLIEQVKRKMTTPAPIPFKGVLSKVFVEKASTKYIALFSGAVIATLVGFYIPALVIENSPLEFLNPVTMENPVSTVFNAFAIAVGFFVVWGMLVYWFLNSVGRVVLSDLLLILASFFVLSFYVIYPRHTTAADIFPFIFWTMIFPLVAWILLFIIKKYSQSVIELALVITVISILFIGITNVRSITKQYEASGLPQNKSNIEFTLSQNGKNVVVIMLDRAVGYAVTNAFETFPELQSSFDGFTYYSNALSFGAHTNIAAPALFGGYDYIPDNINARSDESLEDKHNESLLVMPRLFSDNDFNVTVIDAPYAGYQEVSDISIFDDIPNTNAYYVGSNFVPNQAELDAEMNSIRERDFVLFSICWCLTAGQDVFFDNGNYNNPNREIRNSLDLFYSFSDVSGDVYKCVGDYYSLASLSDMTVIEDNSEDNFVLYVNNLTHDDLTGLTDIVDIDCDYEAFYADIMNRGYKPSSKIAYQTDTVALFLLAEWFDYLREAGLYDNTRIIIVADHGFHSEIEDFDDGFSLDNYNPLVMYKDFDSEGFNISSEPVTNADTPYLATNMLIEDAVNPYTGNEFCSFSSYDGVIRVCASHVKRVSMNNGNTFINYNGWYEVDISGNSDFMDINNWEYYNN